MLGKVLVGVALVVAFLLTGITILSQESVYTAPEFVFDTSAIPTLPVGAWGIFNPENGDLYVGENVDSIVPIASITKLRTTELLLDSDRAHASITIAYTDVVHEGRAGSLRIGDEFVLRTLAFPTLLESSNDAAEAIARAHDREIFMAAMNAHAYPNTTYADASGLSDRNVSSVRDLSQYLSDLFTQKRHVLDVSMLSQYVSANHGWLNNSPVRHLERYIGGKHGYTHEAKNTLVAIFTMDVSGGTARNYGIVILGSDDLLTDTETLQSYIRQQTRYE